MSVPFMLHKIESYVI